LIILKLTCNKVTWENFGYNDVGLIAVRDIYFDANATYIIRKMRSSIVD